jgi:hypothetical protein
MATDNAVKQLIEQVPDADAYETTLIKQKAEVLKDLGALLGE